MKTKIEEMRRENKLDDLLSSRRTAAEVLTEKDGNVDFQLACLSLSKMDELGELFSDLIGDQPLLTIPIEAGAHRYHFRKRQVTFQGRVEERRQLEDFLFSPESFSLSQRAEFQFHWWLLTGPGGAGKSRLALELCIDLGLTRGRCGFLSSRQLEQFNWENWQPESLTVLVIDYVSGAYENVLKLVQTLNQRKTSDRPLQNPVRLLLLEREAQGTWWERFSADNDARASCYARDAGGTPTPVALIPLGEDLHWEIIAELHRQACKPLPDREETLETLARIDPQRRPLFSVFSGYALIQGQHIRDWNATQLLNFLLLDEKKVWERAARDLNLETSLPLHLNLLALTTLCGGLYEEPLFHVLEKNLSFLPALEEGGRPVFSRELYEALSDVTTREGYEFYESLQPDIFGEFVLLHDFLENRELTKKNLTDRIVSEAWLTNPVNTGVVMMRLFDDFPNSINKERLHSELPETATIPIRWWWTRWAIELVSWYGERQIFNVAKELYSRVCEQASITQDKFIVANQAGVIFNLINCYGEINQLEEIEKLYQELNHLSQQAQSVEVFTEQAKSINNMIAYFGRAGRTEDAHKLYQQLKKLSVHQPNEEILVEYAKAIVNLIAHLGRVGKIEEIEEIYQDGITLNKESAGIDIMVISHVKMAFNYAKTLIDAGRIEDTHLIFKETDAIVRSVTSALPAILLARLSWEIALGFAYQSRMKVAYQYLNYCLILIRLCADSPDCREHTKWLLQQLQQNFGQEPSFQQYLRELSIYSSKSID